MYIPKNEQETVINISRDSNTAKIYSTDKTMLTRLDKMCEKAPQYYKCTSEDKSEKNNTISKEYICTNKYLIIFKTCKGNKRNISDTDREKRRIRAQELSKRRFNH